MAAEEFVAQGEAEGRGRLYSFASRSEHLRGLPKSPHTFHPSSLGNSKVAGETDAWSDFIVKSHHGCVVVLALDTYSASRLHLLRVFCAWRPDSTGGPPVERTVRI